MVKTNSVRNYEGVINQRKIRKLITYQSPSEFNITYISRP